MKRLFEVAAMMIVGALLLTSCSQSDLEGFKKTKTGLHYKFEVKNNSGQQLQKGDVLVGEMEMKMDTTILYSNAGNPQRLIKVNEPMFKGDLPEGLVMMHIGETAIFAIEADSIAKFFTPEQMPPMYVPGQGMKLFYKFNLQGIISEEELAQEQANYMQAMQQRQEAEPEAIAQYIEANNITTEPTEDGLYIIVNKKGNGKKIVPGSDVKINYTGRLLNGQIFDSSIKSVAQEGNIYVAQRPYEPLSYKVGQMSLIQGWEKGVMGQTAGSKITLIIPSALAYGAQGASDLIPPYTPLTFEMDIVEVK